MIDKIRHWFWFCTAFIPVYIKHCLPLDAQIFVAVIKNFFKGIFNAFG